MGTVISDIPNECPVTPKLCYYLMNICRLMLVYEHLPTLWKRKAGVLWNMCNCNSTALYCDQVKTVPYFLMLSMVM
jgi:hypothetical protein